MSTHDGIVAVEEWKPIEGFPGYEVSNIGRVRSWRIPYQRKGRSSEPRILRPAFASKGKYHRYCLCNDSGSHVLLVHQLVIRTFVGPPPTAKKKWCCHRNDDGLDNRVENLYWGDGRDNQLDGLRNGKRIPAKGVHFPQAKLNDDKVREIRRMLTDGQSQDFIARHFGVNQGLISKIKLERAWKHVLD